jgi:hypothetical protein
MTEVKQIDPTHGDHTLAHWVRERLHAMKEAFDRMTPSTPPYDAMQPPRRPKPDQHKH